jgi:hypothetical protein
MLEALSEHFPGVITDVEFASRSFQALQAHGFEAQNTFAGVGLCRDELTRPLADKIRRSWGEWGPMTASAQPVRDWGGT